MNRTVEVLKVAYPGLGVKERGGTIMPPLVPIDKPLPSGSATRSAAFAR
jgi:hypothetical protein